MRGPTVSLALALVSIAVPAPASACGGCFAPMGSVSVVNAHRMAFLSSPSGSVLWDQIQYTGSPEDFVWVLPVAGDPTIEVADPGFFEALENLTTIRMTAPPPPRTFCGPSTCPDYRYQYADAGAAISLGDASAVHVLHEGVVGPYETATIMSTDPMALLDWLQAHGYVVNDALLPTISYYVDHGMNFVALRLAPMQGIDRMSPVRIRMPGLALELPLRMVAAGVGTEVELELFVFAESRMEAANFGNAEVDRAAITFDWANRTFDYDTRFDDALFSGDGVLNNWVSEYAQPTPTSAFSYWQSGSPPDVHSAAADAQIVTEALTEPYLTRLRTRLPPSQLATDLTLRTSSGADIGAYIYVTRELHRAPDVTCPPPPVCNGPGGTAGGGCTIGGTGNGLGALAALGVLSIAMGMRGRRRS